MWWILKDLDLKKKKVENLRANSHLNCRTACGPGGAEVGKVVSPEKG